MIPRTDDHARLLRLIGLAAAIGVSLFMLLMARGYALPHAGAWMAAPVLLWALALAGSLLAARISAHAGRVAAIACLAWPPCVMVALILQARLFVPALLVSGVLIAVAGFVLRAAE